MKTVKLTRKVNPETWEKWKKKQEAGELTFADTFRMLSDAMEEYGLEPYIYAPYKPLNISYLDAKKEIHLDSVQDS